MIRAPRVASALAAPLRWLALAMFAPVVVAFLYEPLDVRLFGFIPVPSSAYPFLASIALCAVVWLPAHLATRRLAQDEILDREAYLSVALGWLVATLFAGLPFLISGALGPIDSFFEAMSGLTATGMTALASPVDHFHYPLSLLFWRATLQWVGGLAFIVLTAALLSRLTHGGLRLFGDANVGATGRMRPKITEVARGLGRIYAAFTLFFIVALYAVLRWHIHLAPSEAAIESVVETFAAYGNGAFTLHSYVPYHTDGFVQLILSVMMVAGATNLTLAVLLLRRRQWRTLVRNPEWRFFLLLLAAAIGAVALILWADPRPDVLPLRDGAFHVTSVATGTGLWSDNFAFWPASAVLVMMLVMLVGGTAGSAAGGIKAFRALTLLKLVGRELRRLVHPKAVIPVRVGRRVVAEETVSAVTAFFFTFLIAWFIGTIALSIAQGRYLSLEDASSASLAAMSNVGTGFGKVGPEFGVAQLNVESHMVLAALMWFGRMEIFAALLVFTPQSWRN